MRTRHIFGVVFLVSCTFSVCGAQCTFPDALQGSWLISNSNRYITITANTIQGYPMGSYGTFDLQCNSTYDDKYVLVSTTGVVSSIYGYLCFDFRSVNTQLYYYYLATNDNFGFRAVFKTLGDAPTNAEVCELSTSQYDPRNHEVIIKDGDGYAARTACPQDLATGWRYAIDSACSATSGELRGCEDSQLSADYSVCSSTVFYSSSGLVYCLASVVSGSVTYLTVFNSDTLVDNSATYRTASLVFETSSSGVSMTQYPTTFDSGQTPTSVNTSDGSVISLSDSFACSVTDYTPFIVLGVLGGLLILGLICLAIFMVCTWKGKPKAFRGRLEPQRPAAGGRHIWYISSKPQFPGMAPPALENGFKRFKDDGKPHSSSSSSSSSSDSEGEDAPTNVMQLIRKDTGSSGGRDTPGSSLRMSINTPNPGDGDSSPLPTSAGKTRKKKAKNGDLEEPEGGRTPVVVLSAQAEGSDIGCDSNVDDDAVVSMYDPDGQNPLFTKQGAGIHDTMIPHNRLPPIDEGSGVHRSHTGSGNNNNNSSSKRRKSQQHNQQPGNTTTTNNNNDNSNSSSNNNNNNNAVTTFSEHNPTIIEEGLRCDTPDVIPHSSDTLQGVFGDSACGSDRDDAHSARSDTPTGRRSSLGVLYKMEGNSMVAIPDALQKVETGSGTAGKKGGSGKRVTPRSGRKPDGVRLKPLVRAGSGGVGGRRGSLSGLSPRGMPVSTLLPSAAADPKKKRAVPARARDKGKPGDMLIPDDEEFKPAVRVKVTRVDIPELLPPGEVEARAPGENELLECPGQSYNTSQDEDHGAGEGQYDVTPRKIWLQPTAPPPNVWGRVSNLWKLGSVNVSSWQDANRPT